MILRSKDYKQLVSNRTEEINNLIYGQDRNQPINWNAPPAPEVIPDFNRLKQLNTEIGELIEQFETSLGPA